MIIAGAFLLGIVLALAGAVGCAARAIARIEAVATRLEDLAAEQCADAPPATEPGPLTTDTMEPEDAAVVKKRNRRGYFA